MAANQSGRALCGFSAGGGVSHYGLLYYSDWFDYFGIWGCGESTTVPGDFNAYVDYIKDYADYAGKGREDEVVSIGVGSYDVARAGGYTVDGGTDAAQTIRYDHTYRAYMGLRDVIGIENLYWYNGAGQHDGTTSAWLQNIFFNKHLWSKETAAAASLDAPPSDDHPFTDVTASDWFSEAVVYAYKNSLMKGVSGGEFAPLDATTRATAATVLCRLDGEPAVTGTNSFTDLTQDWYKSSVQWAVNNGIMTGASATAFDPNGSVTREGLAVLLHRCAQYKGYDVSARADLSGYADVDRINPAALESMRWAIAAGLNIGETETALNPTAVCTRAVFASVMTRFNEIYR
ncbi:MAG: S-layer homology domain-containing protein [Peptococcaceae bacterium]|nr:S-layer homology domain-containing protein [Peptococcaceae bacterium]